MRLIGQLNTLESAGLARLVAAQPELEYLFRHALVQDAAYGSLLKQDRRQLHLAVGKALERLYLDQLDKQAAILAYHLEKAEVRAKAIHYLTVAGNRAQEGYANAEAMTFYRAASSQIEQILSQTNESPEIRRAQLARLFENLADLLELTGQHKAAGETYHQALAALLQISPPDKIGQARIYRKIGHPLSITRQNAEAGQVWEQAESALGQPQLSQLRLNKSRPGDRNGLRFKLSGAGTFIGNPTETGWKGCAKK